MNTEVRWIRSRRCDTSTCLQVRTVGGRVQIRNSTQSDIIAEFTVDEWRTFVAGVRDGEFDA